MAPRRKITADDPRSRLLSEGRRIVAHSGLRGLTVRGVAAKAKVNLGTFVYHFGTREAFVSELMESWYEPLYTQLTLTVDEELPPMERIRLFFSQLASFLLDNRAFVRQVAMDAADEEEAAIRFVKSLFGRHPQLMFRLVREAQAKGELPEEDPIKLGLYLFGATLFPVILVGVLMPDGFLPKGIQGQLRQSLLAQEEIERRFLWALGGMRPKKKSKAVLKERRGGQSL